MSQKLANLSARSKIEFGSFQGVPIVWQVAEKNHTGMPADSTLLVSDKILACLPFDAAEPNSSDGNRKSYGNNSWAVSNLRQWLNSKAGAGQWYSAQHSADHAPDKSHVNSGYNSYDTLAGFLNGWTQNEIDALLETDRSMGNYSGNAKTCKDKVFLLTTNEYGLETTSNNGTKVAIFSDNASRIAYPTAQCVSLSNWPNVPSGTGSAWYYWTCTSYPSDSCSVGFVNSDGTLGWNLAYRGHHGVRPACNLSSSILVSDSTNAAGNYTIIYNQPPTAPGTITVPEKIVAAKPFDITWSAGSDPEGALTGYELERKLDGGDWGQIYNGSQRSYTDTVAKGSTSVKYRVRSKDSANLTSVYTESPERMVLNNQPPEVSMGEATPPTVTSEPPTVQYTVTDPDGDAVTAREYVDGKITKTYQPQLSETQTMTMEPSGWEQVLNGTHRFSVVAEDPDGETATGEATWTKDVTTIDFQLAEPLKADDRPTVAVLTYGGLIPMEANLKIEICNNGNDEEPTWVDCTNAARSGQKVFMPNETKTADEWGVDIHVHVERGDAQGDVYINRLDGNFA